MPSLTLAIVLVCTSFLSVVAALLLAPALAGWLRKPESVRADGAAVFLVENGALLDSNTRGRELLRCLSGMDPDDDLPSAQTVNAAAWDRLLAFLLPVFPDLAAHVRNDGPASPAGAEPSGWNLSASDGSGLRLTGQQLPDGVLRLRLASDAGAENAGSADDALLLDRLSWQAMTQELDLLRRSIDLAPAPAWRENAQGEVIWANGAYLRLLREVDHGVQLKWPLPPLFRAPAGARTGQPAKALRVSLTVGSRGRQHWFDLVEIADGDSRLFHALPADEAQRAERARLEFVQTLTKTFATLPIGLAVFDRTRRLHLFNPALADLTLLEPEFLASRPGLEGFLNRMRDKRILPEPRDYRAWSRRLLDVETAGTGAGFEETWSLGDGRTFRVSAAPHPDGALAFLIQDTTTETHLKRSFRAELECGQNALDMVDTGLAMFSAAGDLIFTNAAFDRLWTLEDADTLIGVSFREAVANWRAVCDAPALWDRISALARPDPREAEIVGEFCLESGEVMQIRARLAPDGGVLLAFQSREPRVRKQADANDAPRLRRAAMA